MTDPRPPVVTFDIGGTSLRAGLYDGSSGSIARRLVRPTPNRWRLDTADVDVMFMAVIEEMRDMAAALVEREARLVVAVAFPGPIDPEGNVLRAPTVHGCSRAAPYPLAQRLAERWPGADVRAINDVTAAGYSYVARGARDFCIVTVSSGIGNKLFLDGRPVVGPSGRGGEIGHWQVDPAADAPLCDCGGRGHLGAIASGRGTLSAARRAAAEDPAGFRGSLLGRAAGGDPSAIDNPEIVRAFRDGDPWTTAVVREGARLLGRALAGIHTATGVERFIVFGGFALALGEGYRRELARAAAEACWDLGQAWDRLIELGCHGDDHGLIGAAHFATCAAPGGIT